MQFKKFPMIKPHGIHTIPKDEYNTLLVINDEHNHERHPFEEESHYLRFLLTTTHMISPVLIFFVPQKQQVAHSTLVLWKNMF